MESPEDEGTGCSEEPKPSCPERQEHMDCDDGQMVHESINPFHSDENSHIPVTKSFAEGERLRDIVCCTACGQQVTHYEDSVYRHPALNVLICESCYIHLSEDISHDSTRPDKHCSPSSVVPL
ncbi:uncharacterized protein LOC141549252 isoform X2 [Sminthopsis crassicaudata]|uniref:uncharacterized protein LOC141549252 isoform X2 n=1 Tax=Sminthopsis crassicaudata TaxID=9301 RepID=UPI003D69652D